MGHEDSRLLTEAQTCRYLQVSRSYLARARMEGPRNGRTPGPPFVKLGRAVRYDIADLDAWIQEHRRVPTRAA